MKLILDTEAKTLTIDRIVGVETIPLYSKKSFELLSEQWSKVAWNEKYTYTFTWMGIPTIQLPEDMIRMQEVLWRVKPDVMIECGVAHGGGAIYLASLCKAIGKGRVIGVEIEFRGDHREQIENHPLGSLITLVQGSSVDPNIVHSVKSLLKPHESVLVVLDSNHTKKHVADELNAYHDIVSVGSYIVATDGCMEFLHDVPRAGVDWKDDNPAVAAREFAATHHNFIFDPPKPIFNESKLTETITHWPDAWLKRVS